MKRYLLVGFTGVMLIVVTIALPGRTPSAARGQALSSATVLGGVVGGTGLLTPLPSPLQKPAPKLVRVGSNLKAPRQIYSVNPEYPTLARQANIHETVAVEAIIDEQGNVAQAQAISGHPLLIAAALKAVLQWKYEPTSLNDQPMSVKLQVFLDFK